MTANITKNIFIAGLLLFLAFPPAFSQEINLGLKGGIDFPFFTGTSYDDEVAAKNLTTQFMYGFTGGAFLTIEGLNFLALQPEVLFTMAGSAIGSGGAREVLRTFFLEIPVLVKGMIDLGIGQLSIYAGPDFLFKLGDFNRVDQNGIVIQTFNQALFNNFLLNAVFGLDFSVLLGPGRIFLDARYNWGLTPIFNSNKVAANDYLQNMVQVFIGYGVRLWSGRK